MANCAKAGKQDNAQASPITVGMACFITESLISITCRAPLELVKILGVYQVGLPGYCAAFQLTGVSIVTSGLGLRVYRSTPKGSQYAPNRANWQTRPSG